MDNIQDIIIFLFIAFSILSSLLKKKKKAGKEKQPARTVAKRPAFNLEELLGLQFPSKPKKSELSEVDAYFLQSEIEEERKPIPAKTAKKTYSENRAAKIKELESLKNERKRIHSDVKIIATTTKTNYYKKKISDISSLREYVIMNEILGKPIALRD